MTYNVLMGTLNPTHSLIHSLTSLLAPRLGRAMHKDQSGTRWVANLLVVLVDVSVAKSSSSGLIMEWY